MAEYAQTYEVEKPPPWLISVDKKRVARESLVAPFLGKNLADGDAITSIDDLSQLASLIAQGKLKSCDVVLAYIHRAAAAHEKDHGLIFADKLPHGYALCRVMTDGEGLPDKTETLFADALKRATALDDFYAQHGKTVGPLHGVPMSLKDQFNVRGHDTTLGYVGRAFKPASEDADIVKILKSAGAIIIAKTNLPQSIMWCETENPLWGLTTNPHNPNFTPGGSSGGESALLAKHGSILGWGTDIGGSVRIPAYMVGVYGFKPSSSRLPYEGVPVSTEGQEHVPSAVGPMARSLPSIQFTIKEVLRAEPWKSDPRVDPRPWNEDSYQQIQSRPLTIGLLLDDGVIKVHPSIERIVKDVAMQLEGAGHSVFPWPADGHGECIRILDVYYTADGGEDIKRDMEAGGEPYIPHVQAIVSRAPAVSVYEYWQLNRAKRAAQKAYLKKWQNTVDSKTGRQADILLTPVMPHPAVPHRSCRWVGYTKVWNVLDYPALVIPVGQVNKSIDVPKNDPSVTAYVPRNEIDKWNWNLYDPQSADGMPLGVQIVGRRLQEEQVLAAGKIVEQVLDR